MKTCSFCSDPIIDGMYFETINGEYCCLDCDKELTVCPECNHVSLYNNTECLHCGQIFVYADANIHVFQTKNFIELFLNNNAVDYTIFGNEFTDEIKEEILKVNPLFEAAFDNINEIINKIIKKIHNGM